MNAEAPTEYDQVSPEAAAHIDAVCDRFEQAWKAVPGGAAVPNLSTFLDDCPEAERRVLNRELTALDHACRQRYGAPLRLQDNQDQTAAAEALARTRLAPDSPLGFPIGRANYPSLPGLEILEFLGTGGMGVVFKARQPTLDREVAVKMLRDPHLGGSELRERFLQEARAVARLRHPHLVQLYEFGEAPLAGGTTSQPYLVLEYVSGGNLADRMHGLPQSPREAARLVETLAHAIHYAHQQGVIHRDLKPTNVLLHRAPAQGEGQAEEGRGPRDSHPRPLSADVCAKITDFGLAKFLAGSDLTHSGDVLGTPSYMAPEQAAGRPVTSAVDIYGLGAILYEALTGRPPFSAATVEATLGLVRRDEPVPPRRLQPTVPRDLETICLKCLRKEPGRRYGSAQDLADDLQQFRAGEPIRARPVGAGERIVVWCRRKPAIAGLLAALMLVFLTGSFGVLWQWHRASHNAADALRERDAALQAQERAERRLQMVRDRVDRLNQLGHDLLLRPGQWRTGKEVLEEALAFYQKMLPEESNDPRMRREAAELYRQVASIHLTLGKAGKAAEAYGQEARLLIRLLKEEPDSKDLRYALAHSHRWRGNVLRDMARDREAREEYDLAAGLQKELLRESPNEARYQMALANTLLNTATLLSSRDHAEELELLYRRAVKLDRAAVGTGAENPEHSAELALALGDQGMFFLDMGRPSQATAAVTESLKIYQKLLADGLMKGSRQRYAARAYFNLGRVLAATGQAPEAEKSYQKAVNLLDPLVKELPDWPIQRAELAATLAGLADLYKDLGRPYEAEELLGQAIAHYEKVKDDCAEDPHYRRNLVLSYLELVSLLWQLDRQSEAAEPFRKALELDADDPAVNKALAWFLATTPEPRLRDAAQAVRLAKKAVTARPKSADCRTTLGVAHYRNGDNKAAVVELEKALTLRASGSRKAFFLAMAYWRLGNRDQAQTWFDQAVQWMDRHKPHDELRRFRAEAEALLAKGG
jgi:tetratricopeptide (TPR) repeat protein